MTFVKICGVMDAQTAACVAELGASYIGMIFASESRRSISVEKALEITQALKGKDIKTVGIFTSQNGEEMQKIIDETGLDVAQLHGKIPRMYHMELEEHIPRFYVCPVSYDGFTLEENHQGFQSLDKQRDFLFYDGMTPGSGKPFNWENFEPRRDFNFILAGGLNAANVKEAIKKVQPDGVDVSSGVENQEKKKDAKLIEAFIKETK
jgi:phosphoribosylanthranilate isomerase